MTVQDFLKALENKDTKITIKNYDDGVEVAEIKASGYASLDDTIEAKEVEQFTVESSAHIILKIKVTTETTDPEDTSNP